MTDTSPPGRRELREAGKPDPRVLHHPWSCAIYRDQDCSCGVASEAPTGRDDQIAALRGALAAETPGVTAIGARIAARDALIEALDAQHSAAVAQLEARVAELLPLAAAYVFELLLDPRRRRPVISVAEAFELRDRIEAGEFNAERQSDG